MLIVVWATFFLQVFFSELQVSAEEYRRFWITFQNQLIQVGTEGDVIPFLSWENKDEPFKVTHIGFATGKK